jgi:hypothetical protein
MAKKFELQESWQLSQSPWFPRCPAINGAHCEPAANREAHGVGTYSGLHHRDCGQELLLRNEYLAAENQIMRAQLKGRPKLSDAERALTSGPGEIGVDLPRPREGESDTYSFLEARSVRCQPAPTTIPAGWARIVGQCSLDVRSCEAKQTNGRHKKVPAARKG